MGTKRLFRHIKTYTLRGLLAVVPLALSLVAIRLLYVVIDQRVRSLIDDVLQVSIPGLGILLTILALYLIGLVSSNLVGRKIFSLIEQITSRIPLIRYAYQVGKQVSTTLSLPEGEVFKRVVLVTYLKPGIWTVGFVTGTVTERSRPEEKLLKVFVPTPPNPTTGTMVLVKESDTRDPGWTVEEALKTVISAGIIGPQEIN